MVQPLTADLAHFESVARDASAAAAAAHAITSSLQHQLVAQQAVIDQLQALCDVSFDLAAV
eukprot:6140530-Amphidinium_carterae.1